MLRFKVVIRNSSPSMRRTRSSPFVSQEFPAVQLVQSSCHLLAEPCVMVDVVFHKLLHVFLCTALVLGSGSVDFRLELWRKMHFHNFLD